MYELWRSKDTVIDNNPMQVLSYVNILFTKVIMTTVTDQSKCKRR